MVFSSVQFLLVFLPFFLAVYYLTPARRRNGPLVAASLLFYSWGAPRFVVYLVASCAVDYLVSLWVTRSTSVRVRKAATGAIIGYNIAVLLYFKYANFFAHEAGRLLESWGGSAPSWAEVALPIGISFFTFHKISYIVDVYRRQTEPARRFADYLLYIVLFPQLIAGPIVRYRDVAESLVHREHRWEEFFEGLLRFSVGLGKKVLLANPLGEAADKIFALPAQSLPVSYAWFGALAYSFQIYFDFAGYSDMAVGLARLVGIRFPENFNRPYTSASITEFWRRWHISLSTFMRDYVYVPLGGNRSGALRTHLNLWTVFLISGFWHGASWSFLLWGAYHGLFLVLERIGGSKFPFRPPRVVAVPLVFFGVMLGWVLFRSPDAGYAGRFIGRMFALSPRTPGEVGLPWERLAGARIWFLMAVSALCSFLPAWDAWDRLRAGWQGRWSLDARRSWAFAGILLLSFLSLCYLSADAYNPFIYFRF